MQYVNWVDLAFVGVMTYFILTSHGFIQVVLEFVSLLLAMTGAYIFYDSLANVIEYYFHLPSGVSHVMGFSLAWMILESVFSLILYLLISPLIKPLLRNPINRVLGYVAGAFQGVLFSLFIITLVFSLPVRGQIKSTVMDSHIGPPALAMSQQYQGVIRQMFNGAIMDSLNFLTVKPESHTTVDLKFKADPSTLKPDADSEAVMLNEVNRERASRGFKRLTPNTQLRDVARAYAVQMLVYGFFAHESQVDHTTPADRVTRAGIEYEVVGENLAYAPDVYIAHQGLMNSPGHRVNILSPDYGQVGIGVVDAGIYGKMFVQEFKN